MTSGTRSVARCLAAALVMALGLALGPVDRASAAQRVPSRIDPALFAAAQAGPTKDFPVIVQAAGELKHGRAVKAGAAILRAGGKPLHALEIVGGASTTVSGAAILGLVRDPDVAYITADHLVRAKFDPIAGAASVTSPGIIETQAPAVWSQLGVTGRGIGIAVVDSGVAAHPDLAGRIVAAIDFTAAAPTVSAAPLGDPGGHGTHVAGLAAGDGTLAAGAYTGTAPQANIIDVRVIDANGYSNVSTILRGLQWVLANRAAYNIRVVNLSLGAPATVSYKVDPLATAAEILTFAGIAVVTAAGNLGPAAGTIATPGYDPYVITVGALDDNGTATLAAATLAPFSSIGPSADGATKPDLVAPGRRMVSLRAAGSTLDGLYPERRVVAPGATDAQYFLLSGTSMAAPVVAGSVALMLERNPTLGPLQVKRRLRTSATPLAFGTPATTGSGALNAFAAVSSIDPARDYSPLRVTDQLARELYTFAYGQPLVWKDLAFHGGVDSSGRLWTDVTWSNVIWDEVTWEDMTWEAFTWQDATWVSVSQLDATWETLTTLSVSTLGGTGGWDLVN